jgi:Leucine-rich repeat (LRR) protein
VHSEPEHAIPRSPYQLLLLLSCLSQCDLSTYPDWQISELKELNLSGCNLSVLPGDVALWSKLASLKKIDLNGNLLKDLPAALEVLAPSLEIMFLSENLFQVVPDVIGRLARLRLLSLRGNKLRELTTVNLPSNSLEWRARCTTATASTGCRNESTKCSGLGCYVRSP